MPIPYILAAAFHAAKNDQMTRDSISDFGDWVGTQGEGLLNNFTGNRDYQLAQNQFDYQKELNATIMEREDTAVQRKVADMEAAGLNPMMLAGSPGAGSPTAALKGGSQSGSRGQPGQGAAMAMSIAQFDADMQLKKSQAELLQAQAAGQRKTTEKTGAEIEILGIDAIYKPQQYEAQLREAGARVDQLNSQTVLNYAQQRLAQSGIELNQARTITEQGIQTLNVSRNTQILAQTALTEIQTKMAQHDYDFYDKHNIPSNFGFDPKTRMFYMVVEGIDKATGERRTRPLKPEDERPIRDAIVDLLENDYAKDLDEYYEQRNEEMFNRIPQNKTDPDDPYGLNKALQGAEGWQ